MYLPSCTYYVSNPAARQPELRPVNSPFLSDTVVNSVQSLRDYGSTWLDNTATKPLPDYRHYACYEPRQQQQQQQQYRHHQQTGKWSVYHHHQSNHPHHQSNHPHHHHRRHLAPSPTYFSPDEPVFRDSALASPSDAVFNNSSERFLGYDPTVVYGGHGAAAAARYHTHSAFSDSNSVVGPFGLSVSNNKATVTFYSDRSYVDRGFNLTYKAIDSKDRKSRGTLGTVVLPVPNAAEEPGSTGHANQRVRRPS